MERFLIFRLLTFVLLKTIIVKNMKIIIINGSPHGQNGVTSQYTKYLEIKFAEHEFNTIEVARKINKLERDIDFFNEILQQIEIADAIIWAFPVYSMLIPSQLKLFVELLFERNTNKVMKGKFATSISSSANFYDHTAHDYMHGISVDLGLKYVKGYSPEMRDLLTENGRNNLVGFASDFFWKISINNNLEDRAIPAVEWKTVDLSEIHLPKKVAKTGNKNIVIISDANPTDDNLLKMLDLFDRQVSHKVAVIELRNIEMKGGCIGCLKCGSGGACFYNDEYAETFEKVKKADAVIYAGAIKDRYYSARFKKFIDRYFSNGHRAVLSASLLGHIVSGPLNQLSPMKETLEAHIEVAHCQRLGVISDENIDPNITAKNISNMVLFLEHWFENKEWKNPQTFLGVGGGKIFRDLVYYNRGVMGADYQFYKENNLLDFPNTNYKNRIIGKIMLLIGKIPALEKEMKTNMNDHRIKPYKEVLENAQSSNGIDENDDDLSKILVILSSIIPPLGFFLFFKHKKKSPNKAKKALGSAIIGIPIGFIMGKYVMPFLSQLLF